MVGDPTADFKKRTQETLLKQKQDKINAEFEVQQAEAIRKYQAEKSQKELQRAAKKARKEAAEAARKAEAERRAAAGEEPLKDEEMKPAEEEDEPDQPMTDPAQDKPPVAELSEEEMKVIFRTSDTPDVCDWVLAKSLNDLTLPDKSEGFDTVTYSWSSRGKAETYFKEWKLMKKLTTRVDDLAVGEWFNTRLNSWKEVLSSWRQKQSIWKAGGNKKDKEEPEPEVPEVPISEATVEEVQPTEEKDEPMTTGVADEDLDVFGVADVLDVGNGEP
ncbi:Hnrnpu, partial [Symbiodinium pilosum]